ncbi:MAG: ferrous iron transport protein A [Pirellulales bacterium]
MSVLSDLPIGRLARVLSVAGTDGVGVRLLEMGLIPGVEIRLLGTAPLGDPLEFELRGYRLSLRRSEAARVEVQVDAAQAEEATG